MKTIYIGCGVGKKSRFLCATALNTEITDFKAIGEGRILIGYQEARRIPIG
jgi:hypothetical protein